jgi:hypothetical protein
MTQTNRFRRTLRVLLLSFGLVACGKDSDTQSGPKVIDVENSGGSGGESGQTTTKARGGSSTATDTDDENGGSSGNNGGNSGGSGGAGGDGGQSSSEPTTGADGCYLKPKTHIEIINACTDAVKINKISTLNAAGFDASGALLSPSELPAL